ncbi:PREDICTED: uncharacterized protein LOC104586305 [Nelumbo nucifera]|uniref:Uncharacterized protein LOC104586305 n=1 Tax=Nelumbo nucifera TaxID=4432 RepID=A0A1U7YP61_NELNU|nr:PREDICTED: uncharacterized protein LOC104586305 [Nelumbo nucifera]
MAFTFSSSSSSVSSAQSPFGNLSNLILVKLDKHNFLLWRAQYQQLLEGLHLFGYLDGSVPCPPMNVTTKKDGVVTSSINLDYLNWRTQDKPLLSWLLTALKEEALATVVGCSTSHEAWSTLCRVYASPSRARLMQIKHDLHHLNKGSKSMTDNFHKVKSLSDSLATVGHPLHIDDIILYTIGGLSSEYDSLVTAITTKTDEISIDELHGILLQHGLRLERQSSCSDITPQANTAMHKSQQPQDRPFSNTRGRGRGRGRDRSPNALGFGSSSPKVTCQVCGKIGHSALSCFHRFDLAFQASNSPTNSKALSATHTIDTTDNDWYPDMGGTHHLTSDLSNLSIHNPYHGNDKIAVGNDTSLDIYHIGNTVLHTPICSFHLKNILHVPAITKNLLFVRQFCHDNDVVFEFTDFGFTVKDKHQRTPLAST